MTKTEVLKTLEEVSGKHMDLCFVMDWTTGDYWIFQRGSMNDHKIPSGYFWIAYGQAFRIGSQPA